MMSIYEDIEVEGVNVKVTVKALIDTGAQISIVPLKLVRKIGAPYLVRKSGNIRRLIRVPVFGIHGNVKRYPLVVVTIKFPKLGVGGKFVIAAGEVSTPIVGMDILNPLGINIDTKTGNVYVKNELWEAFKIISTVGVGIWIGKKIWNMLFEEKSK